jgi:uncharacterized protein
MYFTKYFFLHELNKEFYILVNTLFGEYILLSCDQYSLILDAMDDLNELPEELQVSLKEKHFIYSDRNQEIKIKNKIKEKVSNEILNKPLIFGICLTYNCNSKCIYCYENGVDRDQKVLSGEDIKMIFQAIEIIIKHNAQRKIRIFLEGGEPFMPGFENELSFIFQNVRNLKRRKKNISFYSFTNGQTTLEYFNLIENNKDIIDDFLITIIGDNDLHNHYRPSIINENSYQHVVNTVDRLVLSGVNVKIVLNVDKNNISGISYVKELIKKKEWNSYSNFHDIYMSRIRYFKPNNSDIDESDIISKIASFNNSFLSKQSIDWSDFRLYRNTKACISTLNTPFQQLYSCTANESRQFLFGPCGYIYSCTKATGKSQYAIGTYMPHLLFYRKNIEMWKSYNTENIEMCENCRFQFLCGGGCLLESKKDLNGKNIPKCPNVEKMLSIVCNNDLKNNYP